MKSAFFLDENDSRNSKEAIDGAEIAMPKTVDGWEGVGNDGASRSSTSEEPRDIEWHDASTINIGNNNPYLIDDSSKKTPKLKVPIVRKLKPKIKYGEKNSRQGNQCEQNAYELPQDAFTLFLVSPIKSLSFLYSAFFLAFEMGVLVLMAYDLLRDSPPNNFLKVPPAVDPAVSLSQLLALLIAVITQEDVTSTLSLVSVHYDQSRLPLPATKWKWRLSTFLRLIMGLSVIFISFVFIVQSRTVSDLFKDFAAVTFVADIDDVAFVLARRGFITDAVRDVAKSAEDIYFNEREDTVEISAKIKRVPTAALRLRRVLLIAMFVTMVAIWSVEVYYRQINGEFVTNIINVEFGDQIYDKMAYAFFNGDYVLEKKERAGGRPVYYERGKFLEKKSAKFFYCDDERAWVFSVPSIQKFTGRDNECNWLLRSPETDEYEITEVQGKWSIWTGVVETADHFVLKSAECSSDADCNFHGNCNSDGNCECDDGWLGSDCYMSSPCEVLTIYREDQPRFNFTLYTDKGNPVLAYDKPIWYFMNDEQETIDVLLYTGRRCFFSVWGNKNGTTADALHKLEAVLVVKLFHAFWSRLYDKNTLYFSDPTKASVPDGTVMWNMVGTSRSIGDFGPFGYHHKAETVTASCRAVDCTVSNVCGLAGTCQVDACVCNGNHSGHFCQFAPGHWD